MRNLDHHAGVIEHATMLADVQRRLCEFAQGEALEAPAGSQEHREWLRLASKARLDSICHSEAAEAEARAQGLILEEMAGEVNNG